MPALPAWLDRRIPLPAWLGPPARLPARLDRPAPPPAPDPVRTEGRQVPSDRDSEQGPDGKDEALHFPGGRSGARFPADQRASEKRRDHETERDPACRGARARATYLPRRRPQGGFPRRSGHRGSAESDDESRLDDEERRFDDEERRFHHESRREHGSQQGPDERPDGPAPSPPRQHGGDQGGPDGAEQGLLARGEGLRPDAG